MQLMPANGASPAVDVKKDVAFLSNVFFEIRLLFR